MHAQGVISLIQVIIFLGVFCGGVAFLTISFKRAYAEFPEEFGRNLIHWQYIVSFCILFIIWLSVQSWIILIAAIVWTPLFYWTYKKYGLAWAFKIFLFNAFALVIAIMIIQMVFSIVKKLNSKK